MGPFDAPRLIVLGGGISAERAVSLASSKAVLAALRELGHAVRWIDLEAAALPPELDAATEVIFPVLHGTFGEDGGLQRLLEAAGFAYVGCDAVASAACMDKQATKEAVAAAGVPVSPGLRFAADRVPAWETVVTALGSARIVLKPNAEGSSVGLFLLDTPDAWRAATAELGGGEWLAERRLEGTDMTVGVLDGKAMGVVAIRPVGGAAFDYAHKYTPGQTVYEVPAAIPEDQRCRLEVFAEKAFAAMGARDFARIDFMVGPANETFLEINTLPGLTATSLLPKSASVAGLDFPSLIELMLAPAIERFKHPTNVSHA